MVAGQLHQLDRLEIKPALEQIERRRGQRVEQAECRQHLNDWCSACIAKKPGNRIAGGVDSGRYADAQQDLPSEDESDVAVIDRGLLDQAIGQADVRKKGAQTNDSGTDRKDAILAGTQHARQGDLGAYLQQQAHHRATCPPDHGGQTE